MLKLRQVMRTKEANPWTMSDLKRDSTRFTGGDMYRYAAIARDPDPASDRARQDATGLKEIKPVHDGSRGRYGARKVWHQLRREGRDIARCTVERLMGEHG